MLVETLPLYGGLNHMIFYYLILTSIDILAKIWIEFDIIFKTTGSKCIIIKIFRIVKYSLSDDNLLIQREILSGKFFLKLGGWFNYTLIYSCILPGFL